MINRRGVARIAFIAGTAAALLAIPIAAQQWRNAAPDYTVSLPRDHVSHPAYKIEWWYYTGNVETDRGRRFGYQVTFFRFGVDPSPRNPSRFAVRELYIAHIAVTDVAARRHVFAERINRAGVGWAGASLTDFHVWNEDWEVRLDYGRHRLQAREPRFAIDLLLYEDRPPVLHGDRGFSQKGTTPGNASHYYSLTRMPTEGAISLDGERFDVRGESWMDHEFGSTFLEKSQQGWDWFSLQLADGTDAMLYRLRGRDGSVDPQSSGTLIAGHRRSRRLAVQEFSLVPGRRWTSPKTSASYPIEWRVHIPGEGLDLNIRPVVDGQEVSGDRTGVSYWEGAVDVEGARHGKAIKGRGYLEMTGYAGRALGEFLR